MQKSKLEVANGIVQSAQLHNRCAVQSFRKHFLDATRTRCSQRAFPGNLPFYCQRKTVRYSDSLSLRRADKSASISLDKQKNKKSDIQTTRPGLAQRSTRFFPASYIQLKPLRRVNSCVLLRQLIHPHRKFLNDLHSLPPSRSS